MSHRHHQKLRSIPYILLSLILISSAWSDESAGGASTEASQVPQIDPTVRQYWDDLLHYTMIGNWDMARGSGEKLLSLNPDPVMLLNLAEDKRYMLSYNKLSVLRTDSPIHEVADSILKLIEQGRFIERTDQGRIAAEVKRLSSTTRGRMLALNRLRDSGEWAVPVIISALRDSSRINEVSNIRWALSQLGKDVVNPLVVVLQQCNELHIRLIVLDSLGKIGYESALPYIKEVIERNQSSSELKTAGLTAMHLIDRHDQYIAMSASELYERLGEDYYNHLPSLEAPVNEDQANIWFWDDDKGLYYERVKRGMFDELMTMRSCESSVSLNPNMSDAISLWMSAFFRMEAEGYSQPKYFGEHHADASTYALTAGPEYLHRVLARALKNENRQVALSAIKVLGRNSGQQSLLYELGARQPLMEAMNFGDREVRYSAALAIGRVDPRKAFNHSELVVPLLAEALRQQGKRYAVIVDADAQRGNRLMGELKESGEFAEVISDTHYTTAIEEARRFGNVDLLVLADTITQPNVAESLKLAHRDYRVAFCPTIVLSRTENISKNQRLMETYRFMDVLLDAANPKDLLALREKIMERNHAIEFTAELANQYAVAAVTVLHGLAVARNPVLDLKAAEPALRDSIRDSRKAIQQYSVETLALIDSLDAQRSIAGLGLDNQIDMPIRLHALQQLSTSAKTYGNLLLAEQIEGLYKIVQSNDSDPQLRETASEAFGSLNLPSVRISQLIIDQMTPR